MPNRAKIKDNFYLSNWISIHAIIIILFGITFTKELRQFHSRSGITHQS